MARAKFSIKKEQYDEFYKFLTYDQKDPLDVLHLSVDAPVQFNALLFIPDITKDYFGRVPRALGAGSLRPPRAHPA